MECTVHSILLGILILHPPVSHILMVTGYQLRRMTCPYRCECDDKQVWCANTSLRVIPPKLPGKTRVLDVSRNNISIIEAELWRLKNLQSIDLSYNQISKISLGAFAMNSQLETIQLQGNHLNGTDFSPKDWGDLGKLRSLNVADNKLGPVLQRGIFDGLSALQMLDISYNKIVSIPYGSFTGLQGLSQLVLKSNLLLDVPTPALRELVGLQTLDISNNPMRQIHSGSLPCLANLDVLLVNSMMNLTSINDNSFSCLVNLRCIEISRCPKLVHVSATAFKGLLNLQLVDLSGNSLSHLSYNLLPWSRLGGEHVSLFYNPWCCDCSMKWLATNPVVKQALNKPDQVICSAPTQLKGIAVTSLSTNQFTCPYNSSSHNQHSSKSETFKHQNTHHITHGGSRGFSRSNYENELFPKVFDIVVPVFVCSSLFILILVGTYIKRIRTERSHSLLRSLSYGSLQRDNYACTASNMDLPYDNVANEEKMRST